MEILDKKKILLDAIKEIEKMDERVPTSLVEVAFENGMHLSYFCDFPQIKVGDMVMVEGKLENSVGEVKKILTSFKKPKFITFWIKKIITIEISGEFIKFGDYFLSFTHDLTAEKFITLYSRIKYEDNEVYGRGDEAIDLPSLQASEAFSDEVKERGKRIFTSENVPFIWVKDGVAKAVVRGGNWYEVDFSVEGDTVTKIACDCPYFGNCKHEYAVLLAYKDFLKKIKKQYPEAKDFVICRKQCLTYIMNYSRGKVTFSL